MNTGEPSVERQPLTARGLAKQLGLRIIRITQFLTRQMQQEVLTPSQATVLTLLQDGRAWRLSDLASATGVRPPSMTELISRMERQGWLGKMDTPHDRRGVAVTITEEGRTLLQALNRRQIDLIAGRLALLSDEEKRMIEQALPVLDHLFSGPEDLDQ
jgi:DNA-binding MarR family transcriptional regulator